MLQPIKNNFLRKTHLKFQNPKFNLLFKSFLEQAKVSE